MPRRTTPFAQGCYYYIYNRGAGRQSIVREERNYYYLLQLLIKVAAECRVSVITYCLLPNHYHWLLRQDAEITLRDTDCTDDRLATLLTMLGDPTAGHPRRGAAATLGAGVSPAHRDRALG